MKAHTRRTKAREDQRDSPSRAVTAPEHPAAAPTDIADLEPESLGETEPADLADETDSGSELDHDDYLSVRIEPDSDAATGRGDDPHERRDTHQPQRLVSAGGLRFVLPVVCLLIAVAAMVYVFTDLLTFAKQDLIGPLEVPEVILMVGIGGFVLSGVTLLLAVLPEPGPVVEAIEITREVEEAFPNDTTPDEITQVLRGGGTIPTTEVLDALAECVTRVNRDLEAATARTLNERNRAQAANRRCEEAEARIQGILDGTSDEGAALYRDIAEAVGKNYLAERAEHEATTERLVTSLRAAKEHAEAQATQATARARDLEAAVGLARRDALIEEYRKIHVALNAVSQAVRDDHPAHVEVVDAHLARLRAALVRLAPADPNQVLDAETAAPQMPLVFEASGTKTWTPGPPIVNPEEAKPSKPARRRTRGRKKPPSTNPPPAETNPHA